MARPGDRRPIVAMFLDVVGSTALLESMDPEEWRSIIDGAFERIEPRIRRHGGRVAQYLGDGLLAVFGAPVAHEDDPVRSADAAVEVMDVVREYAAEVADRAAVVFGVRIGLDAGPVVVGNLGAGTAGEYLAVGDAVNTAARLQAAAAPMTILISDAVATALDQRFELADEGVLDLKGRSRPVHASRLLGRADPASRPEIRRGPGRFVGRERELAALDAAVDGAQAGDAPVIALVGDPGVGKTRLLAEWRSRIGDRARWAVAQAEPRGELGGRTHGLATALLRSLPGVDGASDAEGFIALTAPHLPGGIRSAATLADLIWPGATPVQPSDPRGRLAARRAAMVALIRSVAAPGPLAIVLEDLHLADSASIEVLEPLFRGVPRVALVATSRPDPGAVGWPVIERLRNDPSGRALDLVPLDERQAACLVGSLLDDDAPLDALRRVTARAEGNPLFLQHLIAALVDDGALRREGGAWVATPALEHTALPASLHSILLARIDRLEPATRTTLRIASVVGRRSAPRLVLRVGRAAGSHLSTDPADAVAAGLLDVVQDPGPAWVFRHALIQEAAYLSLLRSDRVRLHHLAATALAGDAAAAGASAATIAFHAIQAGDAGMAIRWSLVAGDQARQAHANQDALEHDRAVLHQLELLPAPARRARRREEARALEGIGDVLFWLQRREEALAAYGSAEALTSRRRHLDRARLARKRGGLLTSGQRVEEALAAFGLAERLLGSDPPEDPAARAEWVQLRLDRANCHYFRGDLVGLRADRLAVSAIIEAEGTLEQRIGSLSIRISEAFRAESYGVDPATIALERQVVALSRELGDPSLEAVKLFSLGLALLVADQLDEVADLFDRSLALAEATEDRLLAARVVAYRPLLSRKRRDVERCRQEAAAAVETAQALELPEYEALALAQQAWVAWRDGDPWMTRRSAERAMHTWRSGTFPYPFHWAALLPVLALDVRADSLEPAIAAVDAMLAPGQQRLPPSIDAALRASGLAWTVGDEVAARDALARVITESEQLGYL